jgi:cell division GTPase FtsZ
MSGVKYIEISEDKPESKINVILVGNETVAMFHSQVNSFKNPSDATIFNVFQSKDYEAGIEVDQNNQVNVHISALTDTENSFDLIGVQRSAVTHLEAMSDMISASRVNLVVSCLGDVFASAIVPGIARISAESSALTIGLLTLPHPDDGYGARHKAMFALKNSINHFDSYIQIPLQKVCEILSETVSLRDLPDRFAEMITQITRAIAFGIISTGFHFQFDNEEYYEFFRDAGELLLSWNEINDRPDDIYQSIIRCVKEPICNFEQFERSNNVLVSVCIGNTGISIDSYMRIGQFIRKELGSETNVLVKPFNSEINNERPFVVTLARDFMKKRSEKFDYPATDTIAKKSPSQLPALYRKRYATFKGGVIHHDLPGF